jgi:hypothetical protein
VTFMDKAGSLCGILGAAFVQGAKPGIAHNNANAALMA